MAFTPPAIYVPNDPLQVAKNLRYTGRDGNPVTRQLPADYIVNIGDTLSMQIDNYNIILDSLTNTNNVVIPAMQVQINTLLTSGFSSLPLVSAGCLLTSGASLQPIATVLDLLVNNSCAYNTVLGTTSALNLAIAAQCANLNSAPAFSQNSAMAGLAGWKSTPATIADTINNNWITDCDLRAGMTRVLAAVTPDCSQVIVDAQVTMPNFSTGFNIYFSGYTFIPTGYADTGSSIQIVDSNGNTALNSINIITQSLTNTPYNFVTSGTTLQSGLSYTIYINSKVTNASLGLTCEKTVVKSVSASSGSNNGRFDVGSYSQLVTSGTSIGPSFTIVTGVQYIPRHVTWAFTNQYSMQIAIGTGWYLTYSYGEAILTFNVGISGALGGTFAISWTAFE